MKKNPTDKSTYLLLFFLLTFSSVGLVSCPSPKGDKEDEIAGKDRRIGIFQRWAKEESLILDLEFQYPTRGYILVREDRSEYPVAIRGNEISLFVKRIRGAGGIIAKEKPPEGAYYFTARAQLHYFKESYGFEAEERQDYLAKVEETEYYFQEYVLKKVIGKDKNFTVKLPRYFPEDWRKAEPGSEVKFFARDYLHFTKEDLYIIQVLAVREFDKSDEKLIAKFLASLKFK